ncbi:MAG: hypothetical protein KAH03_07045 [Cocleimonas sp.]|nr:hypothetical protein [Cocleimonas sp.]
MKTAKKITGALLASAAAGLILAGCSGTSVKSAANGAKATKVGLFQCKGANKCKGTSSCKTATSQCKGLNSCKGKGWIPNSASNCIAAGGVVGDPLFSDSQK